MLGAGSIPQASVVYHIRTPLSKKATTTNSRDLRKVRISRGRLFDKNFHESIQFFLVLFFYMNHFHVSKITVWEVISRRFSSLN
jgi:hypothetical protein